MAEDAAAEATTDPPLRTLPWRGGVLTYTDEGPPVAPALVCLHGLPGSVRDFRYLGPHLSPAVRLVRLDLPGFGGSTAHEPAITAFSGRVEAVMALADHLGLARFAVLGHSMGGGTALLTAAHASHRVSLLVLVSSVALRQHRGVRRPPWFFALLARAVRLPLVGPAIVRESRAQFRRRRFPGAQQMSAEDFALQFRAVSAVRFEAFRAAVRGPLPPVIVAYATDDALVEEAVSAELAAALPQARVLRFAEGGHNLQKTKAAELGAAVRAALAAG